MTPNTRPATPPSPGTHDEVEARYRELLAEHQRQYDALARSRAWIVQLLIALVAAVVFMTFKYMHGGGSPWFFGLAFAGIVVGAIAGVLSAHTMRALLYHVAPSDPITLGAVSAVLVVVAVVASYAPARRAMNVDPVEALRSE